MSTVTPNKEPVQCEMPVNYTVSQNGVTVQTTDKEFAQEALTGTPWYKTAMKVALVVVALALVVEFGPPMYADLKSWVAPSQLLLEEVAAPVLMLGDGKVSQATDALKGYMVDVLGAAKSSALTLPEMGSATMAKISNVYDCLQNSQHACATLNVVKLAENASEVVSTLANVAQKAGWYVATGAVALGTTAVSLSVGYLVRSFR